MKRYLFFTLFFCQIAFSQSIQVEEVIQSFNQETKKWQIPLPNHQITQGVVWKERISSLSSKGIRTFVGYADESLIGTISIYKNDLSGSVNWLEKNYSIFTQKGKIWITESKTKGSCGTCKSGHCTSHEHSHQKKTSNPVGALLQPKLQALTSGENTKSIIPSDAVLRIYRLAVLVDYYTFDLVGGSVDKVKTYLANLEVQLNEIFMRDLGVKFELVHNDNLIITNNTPSLFKNYDGKHLVNWSGSKIDSILGSNNAQEGRKKYDIGICLTNSTSADSGMAQLYGVYNDVRKGDAYSEPVLSIIAHEIGHLFGAVHTFSKGGPDAHKTEPLEGTSVMSYKNGPREFFSLYSINIIRKKFAQEPWYYTSEDRSPNSLVMGEKKYEGSNVVYAIKTKNQPPKIDRQAMKPRYKIPQQTAFQFDIKASDPDGHPLIYWAHQTDPLPYSDTMNWWDGKTKFYSKKPVKDNIIRFDTEYKVDEYLNNVELFYTYLEKTDIGELTFWIGAGDADVSDNYTARKDHAAMMDVMPVIVEVVQGIPFKITSKIGNVDENNRPTRKYNGGQKTTLTWNVDENVFGKNSRVRILMSDDFGASWKHILAQNVPNDGSHEVVIPNIDLKERKIHTFGANFSTNSGKGLFRIEVIDHIATAMTDEGLKPNNGGFEIHKSTIEFKDVPTQTLKVKRSQLPEKANVTAVSTCGNARISNYKQEEDGSFITRTWEAKDDCNNTAYFVQHIEIEEDIEVPLSWVENTLPEIAVSCQNQIPMPENPKTKGGKGTVTVTNSQTSANNSCNATIVRTYTATDSTGKTITLTQNIKIDDKTAPTWDNLINLPQNISIKEGEAVPPQENLTATDTCSKVSVEKSSAEENGKIIYKWVAKDECGNSVEHTQTITIKPKTIKENPNTKNPNTSEQDISNPLQKRKIWIYNGVSTQENSLNYFKIDDEWISQGISVEIFNEMGQRIYKNDHYGKNGEVFRGYANEKGVFRKEKPLPQGTYFYIIKFKNGNEKNKAGYLVVK